MGYTKEWMGSIAQTDVLIHSLNASETDA